MTNLFHGVFDRTSNGYSCNDGRQVLSSIDQFRCEDQGSLITLNKNISMVERILTIWTGYNKEAHRGPSFPIEMLIINHSIMRDRTYLLHANHMWEIRSDFTQVSNTHVKTSTLGQWNPSSNVIEYIIFFAPECVSLRTATNVRIQSDEQIRKMLLCWLFRLQFVY